jgi:hypothetical protein
MFGHRFFARRYFAPRYFPPKIAVVATGSGMQYYPAQQIRRDPLFQLLREDDDILIL